MIAHCHQHKLDHNSNDSHSTEMMNINGCYDFTIDKFQIVIITSGDVNVLWPFNCEMVDSFSGNNSDENEFDPLEIGR